jgi:CheY-like chemotaxis protein
MKPGTPSCVKGDAGRFRQILLNLAGNAVKFTEKGHVLIRISGQDEGPSHVHLHIAVEDTGIGIPKDKIGYIFEKFAQAEESTTRRFGGTGLGLTISQHLIGMMGGKLEVASEPGKGSVFSFDVLLEKADAASILPSIHVHAAAENKTPSFSGKQVLVVEDLQPNQFLMTKILEKLGCGIGYANNGIEAVQAMQDKSYDIVFMDCQMPEMDGFEATKQIRDRESRMGTHTTIIALTASAMIGDKEKCLNAGMDDYVIKPFKPKQISGMMEKWCAG